MPETLPRHPLEIPAAIVCVTQLHARTALLVEGWSDEAALEAWAARCETRLADHAVIVLPVGGITNMTKFAAALKAHDATLRLGGLYDASEESLALRGLERAGLDAGPGLTRARARALGFFACECDLEDELIRALGTEAVERVLDTQGELVSFRRFQKQPFQHGRDMHSQLKRFLGTRAGRKARYGTLLVQALAPERVPSPLREVLAHALA
ncbi:MAG: TOPRIM nucleotidyl transferase/hydrolase domain-containing protein [Betaproteobacteria bacterium]